MATGARRSSLVWAVASLEDVQEGFAQVPLSGRARPLRQGDGGGDHPGAAARADRDPAAGHRLVRVDRARARAPVPEARRRAACCCSTTTATGRARARRSTSSSRRPASGCCSCGWRRAPRGQALGRVDVPRPQVALRVEQVAAVADRLVEESVRQAPVELVAVRAAAPHVHVDRPVRDRIDQPLRNLLRPLQPAPPAAGTPD